MTLLFKSNELNNIMLSIKYTTKSSYKSVTKQNIYLNYIKTARYIYISMNFSITLSNLDEFFFPDWSLSYFPIALPLAFVPITCHHILFQTNGYYRFHIRFMVSGKFIKKNLLFYVCSIKLKMFIAPIHILATKFIIY